MPKHVLIAMALVLLTGFGHVPSQFIPGIEFSQTDDLGNGLYAFRWGPYRNLFVVTDEGVIITDPLDAKAAGPMRQEISSVTDLPVRYVAYSHSHWDHASGGQLFKDEGAEFVANEECARNMRETHHPDVVLPDITFDEYYKIELGSHTVEMHSYGAIHDDCMTVMVIRPANILYVVDFTSAPTGWEMEYNPTLADGYLYNTIPFLENVEALVERENIETLVSGHLAIGFDENGKMFAQPATGPVAAVREKREFWQVLFAAVEAELEKGTPVDVMPDRVLASPAFKRDFLDNLDPKGWRESEMWILLRRVGTYIETGR